jgi:endonuclease G
MRKKTEEQVYADWAKKDNQIYVVTGPILNKRYKTIGNEQGGLSVPEYKIILDVVEARNQGHHLLMKNECSAALHVCGDY